MIKVRGNRALRVAHWACVGRVHGMWLLVFSCAAQISIRMLFAHCAWLTFSSFSCVEQGVFAQAMGALGGGQQQQAAPVAAATQQAAAPAQGGGEEGGFDSASGGGAAVKNLGVVGRGTKRINLQPVQVRIGCQGWCVAVDARLAGRGWKESTGPCGHFMSLSAWLS